MKNGPQKKIRLLLIDIKEETLVLIRTYVRSINGEIVEASSFEEAIGLIQKQRFDVNFINLEISLKNWFSPIEEIRSIELKRKLPFTPMIAIVSDLNHGDFENSNLTGCQEFLQAAFSQDDLISVIHRCNQNILIEWDPTIKELIPDYIDRRRSEVENLRELFIAQEFEKISQIGHKLKGSAGTYGLPFLSEVGQKLESGASHGLRHEVLKAIVEYDWYLGKVRFI
jgi:HPt (histidine-containing phosphotransfer) domain-containing protein